MESQPCLEPAPLPTPDAPPPRSSRCRHAARQQRSGEPGRVRKGKAARWRVSACRACLPSFRPFRRCSGSAGIVPLLNHSVSRYRVCPTRHSQARPAQRRTSASGMYGLPSIVRASQAAESMHSSRDGHSPPCGCCCCGVGRSGASPASPAGPGPAAPPLLLVARPLMRRKPPLLLRLTLLLARRAAWPAGLGRCGAGQAGAGRCTACGQRAAGGSSKQRLRAAAGGGQRQEAALMRSNRRLGAGLGRWLAGATGLPGGVGALGLTQS